MERIDELVKKFELQEAGEYIIIPFMSADGKRKRTFLLKRRFIRIVRKDGRYIDYPLDEAIEALLNYPDMKLSDALRLMHGDDEEIARCADHGEAETLNDQTPPLIEDGNPATGRALQA
jgi:hypothetical protein